MIEVLALVGVVAAGLYLVALGVAALTKPALASRFLLGHAGSAPLHYLELVLRILIGLAFVQHAPRMLVPIVFAGFGWVLMVTSACLLLVPWHWHRRFAERAVPQALRYLTLVGLGSLLLGVGVLLASVGAGWP